MTDRDRQALESFWKQRVEDAYIRYQEATAALRIAREIQSQAPRPDGSFAFGQALRAENRALAEYKRVLTIFNELVIYGQIPPED